MKLKIKTKKNIFIIIFLGLLIVSYILINVIAGILFSERKFDLTDNKINTLSEETLNLVTNQPQKILIKLYLSSSLSQKNPAWAQYAQSVIRLLKKISEKSEGKISFETIDPQPFSSQENEALNAGVKPVTLSSDGTNTFFGATFNTEDGRSSVIPIFIQDRFNYLENDLNRAIARVSVLKKKNIGIASDMQIIRENIFQDKTLTFAKILRKDYNLINISTGSAQIPQNIDVLMLIVDRSLPDVFVYALDQYILRGGKLLILYDNYSELAQRLQGKEEHSLPNLDKLLQNIGIDVIPNQILGDRELAASKHPEKKQKNAFYPWFKITSDNITKENIVTKNIRQMFFKSATPMKIRSQENYKTQALFNTSKQTSLIDAEYASLAEDDEIMRYLEPSNTSFVLGALSYGEYRSLFKQSPIKGSAYAQVLLPYLPISIAPSEIIVLADSDILDVRNWAEGQDISDFTADEYNIIPSNNNLDFILRALDYLSGNQNAMPIGGKENQSEQVTISDILYFKAFQAYADEFEKLTSSLDDTIQKLDTINTMLRTNSAFGSIKTLGEIEKLNTSAHELKNKLAYINYQIEQKTKQHKQLIVFAYTILFPSIYLLLLCLIHFIIKHKRQKQARRITNEL